MNSLSYGMKPQAQPENRLQNLLADKSSKATSHLLACRWFGNNEHINTQIRSMQNDKRPLAAFICDFTVTPHSYKKVKLEKGHTKLPMLCRNSIFKIEINIRLILKLVHIARAMAYSGMKNRRGKTRYSTPSI